MKQILALAEVSSSISSELNLRSLIRWLTPTISSKTSYGDPDIMYSNLESLLRGINNYRDDKYGSRSKPTENLVQFRNCFKLSVVGSLYRGLGTKKVPTVGTITLNGPSFWSTHFKYAKNFAEMNSDLGTSIVLEARVNPKQILVSASMMRTLEKQTKEIVSSLTSIMVANGILKVDAESIAWRFINRDLQMALSTSPKEVVLLAGQVKLIAVHKV